MAECICCPFAFTDESEEIQNYGCLPTPWEIVEMKRKSGHNWACHSNEKKTCAGFVDFVENYPNGKYSDINMSTGGLISYDTWYSEGEEVALKKAGGVDNN